MTEETNRPAEVAQTAPQKPQRKIPRVEQAAILLMSLGETDAAEVLKHMGHYNIVISVRKIRTFKC